MHPHSQSASLAELSLKKKTSQQAKPEKVRKLYSNTLKETPLIESLQNLNNAELERDKVPGPGHYRLNIPDQIKMLTEKMAPRYKQNPFGSKNSRFKDFGPQLHGF